MFSCRELLDRCEERFVLGQQRTYPRALYWDSLNELPQFDEIVSGRNGDEEESRWREHSRTLSRIAPAVK